MRVLLDAGHGGNDTGAVSGVMKEKDINLKLMFATARRLEEIKKTSNLKKGTN